MTITLLNLSGAQEGPDKTIRALLENNWDNSNTSSVTPTFMSDTEEPDFLARDDMSDNNLVGVSWVADERVEDSEDEPNGDTIHHWKHILRIDFWADSLNLAREFQQEINRILWENAPDNATRLVKSDASDSEADRFEKTELTFERIEPESEDDHRPSFQTEDLQIHFRKRQT